MTADWIVVIPFKGTLGAKSRLGDGYSDTERAALALAFVRDTLTAALATHAVSHVLVVTNADAGELGGVGGGVDADADRVTVVPEGSPRGLNAAIDVGLAAARALDETAPVAVLLGDLPALRAADLAEALGAASRHPSAFVADSDGTGTTLLTGLAGTLLRPAFGPGSAAAHRAGGAVELAVASTSSIRHDVDTPEALASALTAGVGSATRAITHNGRMDVQS